MRNTLLTTFVLLAGTAAIAGPTPAAAEINYPWCAMGGQLGASGDCSYRTREQCLASVSGRWNLYCDTNRRGSSFDQQAETQRRQQRRQQRREY